PFSLLFSPAVSPLPIPSFPTRRSSDLPLPPAGRQAAAGQHQPQRSFRQRGGCGHQPKPRPSPTAAPCAETEQCRGGHRESKHSRSEEHTSELQSPCNLVCRLLLEKKKK